MGHTPKARTRRRKSSELGYDFNPDPSWAPAVIARYDGVLRKIAQKFCSYDEDMQEDVISEGRIALATVRPERVRAWAQYMAGEITVEDWQKALDRYCRNAIRNAVLSYLDSYATGPWNVGRTRHVTDRRTGASRKVYLPARFSSLDALVDDHGLQVDEAGALSWPDPSDDGLVRPDDPYDSSASRTYGTTHWWTRLPEDASKYEGPADE